MVRAPCIRGPLAALVVFAAGQAFAWEPETRIRQVDEAVRLMPASLRVVLENHRESLLRGALEPMLAEDSAPHRPAADDGTLADSLAGAAAALIRDVEAGLPMDTVARRFGELSHYVADSCFPPVSAAAPGTSRRYRHFAEFAESRRVRFPVVFSGHESAELDARDYQGFAQRLLATSRLQDLDLARMYAVAGDPPAPSAFDDRSVPFAIASLAYSRTISSVARVWLCAWGQAHGDLGRTPYLSPELRRLREGSP